MGEKKFFLKYFVFNLNITHIAYIEYSKKKYVFDF